MHSGQAAVITPRQVSSGLGARRVKTISAAKHHTVAATQAGEVFTWGSNRGEIIDISYEFEIQSISLLCFISKIKIYYVDFVHNIIVHPLLMFFFFLNFFLFP